MHFCDDCGRRLRNPDDICRSCHVVGPFYCGTYWPKDKFPSKYQNDPLTKQLIQNKSGGVENALKICEKMYDYLLQHESLIDDVEHIVPVPIEKHEGQHCKAPLLARVLQALIQKRTEKNIKSYYNVLIRVGKSNLYRKTSSKKDKLLASLRDYKISEDVKKDNSLIKEKNILLIDDLFTDGITLEVCSDLLLQNGAKRVIIFCAGKAYRD